MTDHAIDSRGVEQVGVVLDAQQQTLRHRECKPGHVKDRGGLMDRRPFHRQSRSLEIATRHVLQTEEHLEDRVIAEAALGLQFLDEFFEGQFLVCVPVESYLLYAYQKLAECRSEERRVGKECRSRWS